MPFPDRNNTFWEAFNVGSLPSSSILSAGGQVGAAGTDPFTGSSVRDNFDYYRFTVSSSATVTINLSSFVGDRQNTSLEIYSSSDLYVPIGSSYNSPSGASDTESITLTLTPGTYYAAVIGHAAWDVTSPIGYTLNFISPSTPPPPTN